jgi:hypothetical protein
MIRGVLFFVLIFASVYIGISQYRLATKRERLDFWKQAAYAALPAIVTMFISVAIVYFF